MTYIDELRVLPAIAARQGEPVCARHLWDDPTGPRCVRAEGHHARNEGGCAFPFDPTENRGARP